MDTLWKKTAEQYDEIIPGLTFRETNPPRWMSSLPFVNLYYSSQYFDNNWVMPNRMPDGKTYVGMTDTSDMLVMDIETLEQHGKI